MSSSWNRPPMLVGLHRLQLLPLLQLLLLAASASVVSAGPLDLVEGAAATPQTTPQPTPTPTPAVPVPVVVHSAPDADGSQGKAGGGVPAATLPPATEGQHCNVDGAVFHNGDRLPTGSSGGSADPCRACYCQGGEAVCARVHCYRRPDCAPRHVAGRCCPKYDNCPPAPEELAPEPRFKEASTQTEGVAGVPTTLVVTEALPQPATGAPDDGASTTTDAYATTTATEPSGSTTVTVTATPADVVSTTGTVASVTAASATDSMATTLSSTDAGTTTIPSAVTSSTEAGQGDDREVEDLEDSGEDLTSALPPGIDLHALHDHLPFLNPGEANGPNT